MNIYKKFWNGLGRPITWYNLVN